MIQKQSLILGAIFVAVFGFVFSQVIINLFKLWYTSEDYSHGFFVLPLCFFIIWQKKEKLSQIQIKGSWVGLIITLFALFAYFIAVVAYIETLRPLSMLIFIVGALIFLFGFPLFKELLFPIFILFFMIPIPSELVSAATINLQLVVSTISSSIVSLLGVPLLREGNVIHLPEKTLQVVRACSGMRSLISLLLLSAVFGYFTLRSNFLRILLFVSGIPVAIIVNIVRVCILITFIHFFGIDLSHGTIHTIFGVGVFLLALVLLMMIKKIFDRWDYHET